MSILPKISIITVVYNAAETVGETLKSVSGQTYANNELIVIDGNSEDETLNVVEEYRDAVDVLLSEPDAGIYDAMNKGARIATGDYITFLNAGDIYHSDGVLEDVFSRPEITGNDVIFGSNYYRKNGRLQLQKPRPLKLFYRGMPFNHQSAFVKSEIVRGNPFKHDVYRIQCEYEFLLDLYLKGYSFCRVDVIVAIYEAGGFSDRNFLERTLERWLITKRHGICDLQVDSHYYRLVARSLGMDGLAEPGQSKVRSLLKWLYKSGSKVN